MTTQAAIKTGRTFDLALLHRKAINGVRTLPYMQSWIRHINAQGRPSVPWRRKGADIWTFSNQVLTGPTDISFGPPTVAYFYFMPPIGIDHTTVLNKVRNSLELTFLDGTGVHHLRSCTAGTC